MGLEARAAILDPNFKPAITMENGSPIIYAIEPLANGQILVGGHFTAVNGVPRRHLARLNADGSLDPSFNAGAISYFVFFVGESEETAVHAIAIQEDGKIVIGGYFNYIGEVEQRFVARLNADGSLDESFTPRVNERVNCLALVAGGKILIGGAFTLVDFISLGRLARLNADGTLDSTFQFPGFSSTVFAIQPGAGGKIWVGGGFASVLGEAVNRPLVARLEPDGRIDASFDPGLADAVMTLAPVVYSLAGQPDGSLVIAGNFMVFGPDRLSIARLKNDGALDDSFLPEGVNGSVHSVAIQDDGRILAGGRFTLVNNVPIDNLARFNPDGSLDLGFLGAASGADGIVETIRVIGGEIFVGGRFEHLADEPRTALARLLEAVRPTLDISWQNGRVEISWIDLPPGFILEFTDVLAPMPGWRAVSGTAVPNGGRLVYSDPAAEGARYFRLRAR